MIPLELTRAIEALIPEDRSPRRLFVYATSALYEYYLAADGTVFERDLDSMRSAERVECTSTVHEVYAEAARRYPTLAALATIDPAALPTTFEDALRYPGHVIAAWDDSEPTPTTLIAFVVTTSGARRLASRAVAPEERDAVLDLLGRQHPLGASYGSLVWHVELTTGFNLHDATGRRASNVRAHDVACVRSSRSVELIAASGKTTTVIDDVEPAVASRVARDFASWLGCPHEDNGLARANEAELALVRACRELAKRNGEVPRARSRHPLRVSAGRIGNAADIAVLVDAGAVKIEITLSTGMRVHTIRKPATDDSQHSCVNDYLERPWVVRDIIRAALGADVPADHGERPPITLDEAIATPDVLAAWDRGDSSTKTLRMYATGVTGARELMHVEVEAAERDALLERLSLRGVRIGACDIHCRYVWVADPSGFELWDESMLILWVVRGGIELAGRRWRVEHIARVESFAHAEVTADHGVRLISDDGTPIVVVAYTPTEARPAWDPFVGGWAEEEMAGWWVWTRLLAQDLAASLGVPYAHVEPR